MVCLAEASYGESYLIAAMVLGVCHIILMR